MTSIKGRISRGRIAEIQVDGDRIAKVLTRPLTRSDRQPPHKDTHIAPGFIDIQVNGFAGVDINQPNFQGDDLADVCRNLLKTGVTAFCPTLITADYSRFATNITQIRKAWEAQKAIQSIMLFLQGHGIGVAQAVGPEAQP